MAVNVTFQEFERLVEDSGNVRVHVRISLDGGATWRTDVWVDAVNVDPDTGIDNGFDASPRRALLPFWRVWQARQAAASSTPGVRTPVTASMP